MKSVRHRRKQHKRTLRKNRTKSRRYRKSMRGGVDPSDTPLFYAPGRQSQLEKITLGSPTASNLHFRNFGSKTGFGRPEDIQKRLNDNHDDRSREIEASRKMIQKMKEEAEAKSKWWSNSKKGGKNKSRKGTRRRKQHSKKQK